MRRKILNVLIIVIIAGNIFISAQQKSPSASFVEDSHDFGLIKEVDGPASYKFSFTNTGGAPLVLNNVAASCGCTTPDWSKEPVLPGAKGFINVTYNPQGRPGKFEKTIKVTSNGEPESQVLMIKGEVIPKPPTIEESYPYNMNGLRLKLNRIEFSNVTINKKVSQEVKVFNSSDQPMKVAFAEVPAYIHLKISPEEIKPKTEAVIDATFDAALKNDWGMVNDRFAVIINDKNEPANKIFIRANIREDFAQLTEEQRKNAPKIEFDNTNFDYGTIEAGAKANHNFSFKNSGKSNLIIRKVMPSCGCTVANLKVNTVRPGETDTISVTFNSTNRSGTQNKTVTVILTIRTIRKFC